MIAEVLAALRRDPGGNTAALEAAMMERTRDRYAQQEVPDAKLVPAAAPVVDAPSTAPATVPLLWVVPPQPLAPPSAPPAHTPV